MMPKLKPGEKILVSTLPYLFSLPKVGDVVVFKYQKKYMIKKISKVNGGFFEVSGENKNDSLKVGKISREEILGKMIFKI